MRVVSNSPSTARTCATAHASSALAMKSGGANRATVLCVLGEDAVRQHNGKGMAVMRAERLLQRDGSVWVALMSSIMGRPF